jgi:GTPase SAR1 family protein
MDKDIELIIRDTRGGEDYERLTAMAFGAQDGFLLCFSLDNRKSFDDINDKWNDGTWRVKDLMNIPRPTPKNPLHYTWEHACMILVGLKQDKDTNVITRQEAEEAAKKIGAKKYFEVSSMTQHGMREAFDECLRGAIVSAEKAAGGEKGCCLIA